MDGNASLKKYHATESDRLRKYAKNAGMEMPGKYASGGGVKRSQTTVNIVIGKDSKPDPLAGLAAALPHPPPAPPPAPPPMAGPPPGAPPPQIGGPGPGPMGLPLPGMKKGGAIRATALPMTAGAMSGPGREEKAASQAKATRKRT